MLLLLRFEGNKNTVNAAKSVIFAHHDFHAKPRRRSKETQFQNYYSAVALCMKQ
jgi:hypothetical protein